MDNPRPDVSYTTREFWTWDDAMWQQLRWLRDHDPVHWSERDQHYVVTRFADVSFVSKNQDLFTTTEGVIVNNPIKIGLIDDAEPRHSELRNLINRGFTPRMVKRLEDFFTQITTEMIDAFASRGRCDFAQEFAVPLPLLLIAEIMGIRREDRDRFQRWSDTMIMAAGGSMEDRVKAASAAQEYREYMNEIFADRIENPRDDIVSILLRAQSEGVLGARDLHPDHQDLVEDRAEEQRALSTDELFMFSVLLLVAGNETTRNSIACGMHYLIENDEQRQELIRDPGLIPTAVEEMLRMATPITGFARTVTSDVELGGKTLKEGDKVYLVYSSANRDEREFDSPDVFDIHRNPHHLAFGIGGHYCMGANLARMEMRVAFREILRRLPDMEITARGLVMEPSAQVRAVEHLDVEFTPESAT